MKTTVRKNPAWKIGIPFGLGILLHLVYWIITGGAEAMLGIAVLTVWGGLWVYAAWQSQIEAESLARLAPYRRPGPGRAVVLGRAKEHVFSRPGFLLITQDQLLWCPRNRLGSLKPGETMDVSYLTAVSSCRKVASLVEVSGFQHVAGLFGGDRLEIRLRDGRRRHLRLYSPEGAALLLEAFSESV